MQARPAPYPRFREGARVSVRLIGTVTGFAGVARPNGAPRYTVALDPRPGQFGASPVVVEAPQSALRPVRGERP